MTLTAKPRILFEVAHPVDGLIRKIYRDQTPAPKKEFTEAHLTPGTPEYAEMKSFTTDADRATLAAFNLLLNARTSTERKNIYDAAILLNPGVAEILKGPEENPEVFSAEAAQRFITWFYPTYLTGEIRDRTHLEVAADFVPEIHCDDLRTAVFVFAAYRSVAVCPACRNLFSCDTDRKQKYCSAGCGQRIYQKQYRVREKKKLAVKKSKRSHRTKRR